MTSHPPFKLTQLDHVVLRVADGVREDVRRDGLEGLGGGFSAANEGGLDGGHRRLARRGAGT